MPVIGGLQTARVKPGVADYPFRLQKKSRFHHQKIIQNTLLTTDAYLVGYGHGKRMARPQGQREIKWSFRQPLGFGNRQVIGESEKSIAGQRHRERRVCWLPKSDIKAYKPGVA